VLNRIAVAMARYPRHDEALRVETWSTGINGVKGFRDFRVYDAQGQVLVFASSVWVYISVKTKSLLRVPRDIAETFPRGTEPAWCPELEKLSFEAPPVNAATVAIELRYSDFDANEHVNNAAYLDFVQTALAREGCITHPRRVRLKYAKAIPSDTERVEVRLEPLGDKTRFSIEAEGVVFAQGVTEE
jgi:acyl-ACP thioesterase